MESSDIVSIMASMDLWDLTKVVSSAILLPLVIIWLRQNHSEIRHRKNSCRIGAIVLRSLHEDLGEAISVVKDTKVSIHEESPLTYTIRAKGNLPNLIWTKGHSSIPESTWIILLQAAENINNRREEFHLKEFLTHIMRYSGIMVPRWNTKDVDDPLTVVASFDPDSFMAGYERDFNLIPTYLEIIIKLRNTTDRAIEICDDYATHIKLFPGFKYSLVKRIDKDDNTSLTMRPFETYRLIRFSKHEISVDKFKYYPAGIKNGCIMFDTKGVAYLRTNDELLVQYMNAALGLDPGPITSINELYIASNWQVLGSHYYAAGFQDMFTQKRTDYV